MFTSRVERTISASHHNGPPTSKCYNTHGHDWNIVVEYTYGERDLSDYGWGPDFGLIKTIIDKYDHGVTNLGDDGLNGVVLPVPSAEYFAKQLYEDLTFKLAQKEDGRRVSFEPDFVQVFEGKGNSVIYRGAKP